MRGKAVQRVVSGNRIALNGNARIVGRAPGQVAVQLCRINTCCANPGGVAALNIYFPSPLDMFLL
jgi:hypothetical protein